MRDETQWGRGWRPDHQARQHHEHYGHEHRVHHHHGHQPPPHGRRGGRARRGEAKYLLMEALREGPKHGYEIIKALEERSGGQYAPSPGVVYPTLQFLTEAGLVRAEQEGDRRVFHLTDEGRKELDTHTEEVKEFWARFAQPTAAAARTEIGFLEEELEYLIRAVRGGLRGNPDAEQIRMIRQTVENCRNDVRRIIATAQEGSPS